MASSVVRLQDVITEVYRYLDHEVPLQQLNRFLVPLVWDDSSLDCETRDLVNGAYLRYAEFTRNDQTGGHPTEDELRQGLRELLPTTQTIRVEHDW